MRGGNYWGGWEWWGENGKLYLNNNKKREKKKNNNNIFKKRENAGKERFLCEFMRPFLLLPII